MMIQCNNSGACFGSSPVRQGVGRSGLSLEIGKGSKGLAGPSGGVISKLNYSQIVVDAGCEASVKGVPGRVLQGVLKPSRPFPDKGCFHLFWPNVGIMVSGI